MTAATIVMPFFNAEATLSEAISSVLAQTWIDWELLLIDDGSTDKSLSIASAAAAADDRVRVIDRATQHSGAAAARNAGIACARGEYVAFLDADDTYEAEFLAMRIVAIQSNADVMTVYGPTRYWYPLEPERDWVEDMRRIAGQVHPAVVLVTRVLLLQLGDVPCTCGVLIRREALERIGGFDEQFRLYEDQTLWVKLFLHFPVYVDTYVGARYRQHNTSTTATVGKLGAFHEADAVPARVSFLKWVEEYAGSNGFSDAALERGLRLARARFGGRGPLSRRDRVAYARWRTRHRTIAFLRTMQRRRRRLTRLVAQRLCSPTADRR